MTARNVGLSVIVLAGGHSRRMGMYEATTEEATSVVASSVDKALLSVRGQPLIARVVGRLTSLSDDIIVSTNQAGRYAAALVGFNVREVIDALPDAGPLSGMFTGLAIARYAQVVVVACDMPFVDPDLLRWMATLLPGHDAVVPHTGDTTMMIAMPKVLSVRAKAVGLHPLHAIYHRSCLDAIRAALDQRDRSMGSLLSRLKVRLVGVEELRLLDPQRLSLRNVNTPEDWTACRKIMESE